MASNSPTKEDIRGQLSDIQMKLFGNRKPKSSKSDDASGIPGRSPVTGDVTLARAGHPTEISNRVIPTAHPQLRPESKGKDMDFVVGLSENLLSECRRLAAENQKVKTKLKAQAAEISNYKTQVLSLSKTNSFAANNESHLKDRNWELEANVNVLSQQLESLKSANEKLVKTHNDHTLKISGLQRDNDEFQLKNSTLTSDLRLVQDSLYKELTELNTRIEELNNENDALVLQVSKLNSEKSTVPFKEAHPESTFVLPKEPADSEDPADLDDILKEIALIPTNMLETDPNNTHLELETLKANLAHSNKTISRLRAAILRERGDSRKNTPRSTKKTKLKDLATSANPKRISAGYSPAKRNSKFIVLDDNVDWRTEGDWEQFIATNKIADTPSKPSRTVAEYPEEDFDSSIIANSPVVACDSVIHDSESSDLDFEPAIPKGRRVLSQELTQASMISRDDQLRKYAKDNNLVLLTLEAFATLEHSNINDMSLDRTIAVMELKGFVVVTRKDYQDLMDEEIMRSKLEAKGIVTIPDEELAGLKSDSSNYKSPDLSYLTSLLKSAGYEAVDAEYFESLKRHEASMQAPLETFLFSKCKGLGLHPIPEGEYDRLKAVEADYEHPSKDFLTSKANEMGLILSSTAVYDELVSKSSDPPIEHLSEKAGLLGYSIIKSEELKSLKEFENPNLDHLKSKACDLNMELVDRDHLEQLKELAESPSIEHIRAKASGHTVIESGDFKSLQNLAHNPPLSRVQELAQKFNLVTLSTPEYTDLFKRANEPSIEQLSLKAEESQMSILPQDELNSLRSQAEKPDVEHLTAKAGDLGLTIIDNQELDELRKQAENPSIEQIRQKIPDDFVLSKKNDIDSPSESYLSEKAAKIGMVVVSEADYNSPSESFIAEKAGKLSLVTIPQSEYESPSESYLREKSSKLGLITIPQLEYDSPSQEYLSQKAQNLDMTVIPKGDFESPSNEYISEKAAKLEMVVVPKAEYSQLSEQITNPSIEHLSEKASLLDMVVKPKSEYDELMAEAHSPSTSSLQTKALAAGLATLSLAEMATLKRKVEEPSISELEKYAEKSGLVLIDSKELSQMKEISESPSVDFLTQKAHEKGYATIKESELSEIKKVAENPSVSHLKEMSSRHEHVLLPISEHSELEQLAKNPDIDHVSKMASKLDNKILPTSEYNRLSELAENPEISHLQALAKKREQAILPQSEMDSLLKLAHEPNIERVESLASKLGYSAIEKSKLDTLKTLANEPDLERVQMLAKTHDSVIVHEDEYEKIVRLANKPPVEHLAEKAAGLNCSVVPTEELAQVRKLAHEPDLEHIQDCAKTMDHVIVPTKEFLDLKKNSTDPDLDLIAEKAKLHGHSVLLDGDLSQLKELAHNPTAVHIQNVSKKAGLIAIPVEEHSDLVKRAKDPTIEEIRDQAQRHGLETIEKETLDTMKKSIDHPTFEYLSLAISTMGYVAVSSEDFEKNLEDKERLENMKLIPNEEYIYLSSIRDQPSVEFLREKAKSSNFALVNESELEQLKSTVESPSVENISEWAKQSGYVIVEKDEFNSMTEKIESPSTNFLTEKALLLGLSVTPTCDLSTLKKKVDEPSLDYLTRKSLDLGHVVIPVEEHQKLESSYTDPSVDFLKLHALKRQMSVIPEMEVTQLRDSISNPSLEYLQEQAAGKGFEILSKDKVERFESIESTFKNPDNTYLKEKAEFAGFDLVEHDQYLDFSSTREKIQSPSELFLEEIANKIQHTAISSDRLSHLEEVEKSYEKPSQEYLREKSNLQGYDIILMNEIESLREYSSKEISELAAEKQMAMIPLDEYSVLVSEQESNKKLEMELVSVKEELKQTVDDLERIKQEPISEKASSVGMVAISQGEFSEFNQLTEKVRQYEESIANPSDQYLSEKLAQKNKVLVDTDEFEDLQKLLNKSIFEKAALLSMVAIPVADHTRLKSLSEESLESRAKRDGMHVISSSDYTKLMHPELEHLKKLSEETGHTLIPQEEFSKLMASNQETLESKAHQVGMVLMPISEHRSLQTSVQSPSLEYLTSKAQELNQQLISSSELEQLKKEASMDIEDKATRAGLVVLPTAEFGDLHLKANEPTLEHLQKVTKGTETRVLSEFDFEDLQKRANLSLEDQAKVKDLRLIPTAQYDDLLLKINKPSIEQISANAERNGMAILSVEELEGLKKSSEELERLKKSAETPLEETVQIQGFELISSRELQELKNNAKSPNEEILRERALELNQVLVSKDQYLKLLAMENVQLEDSAKEKDMKILPAGDVGTPGSSNEVDQRESLDQNSNSHDVRSWAALASGFSMAVLLIGELTKLKQSIVEKDSKIRSMEEKSEVPDLQKKLREMGMIMMNQEEYQKLKRLSEEPKTVLTEAILRDSAQELGYNIVLNSEYHDMKQASLSLEDESKFKVAAKKLGLVCVPESSIVCQTSPGVEMAMVPMEKFRKMEEFDMEELGEDESRELTRKRRFEDSVGENSSMLPSPEFQSTVSSHLATEHTNSGSGVLRLPRTNSVSSGLSLNYQESIAGSLTALSIGTNISFTDRSMIPAITQVVIGEYLFKYFRRLGPLSSISSSRHERYFWVHPYSLTLYWSTSNPVLANPSEVKTKAIAISRVESVEDPNPLPPGLHYKSIIVHSPTGSVKITCPTRQRHNVWYNALRYLVNRNVEDPTGSKALTQSIYLGKVLDGRTNRIGPIEESQLEEEKGEDPEAMDYDFSRASRHAFPRSSSMPRIKTNQLSIKRKPLRVN